MSPVFRHGRLRLYLLKLLDEAPRHGYEVIRLLQDRFMGIYAPSPGTIYPRLARLEEEGLVTHDEADGRKVYRITEKGREELRARLDDLAELEEEITASVRDIAREVTEDVRDTVRTLREELSWAAREFHSRAHQAGGADVGGDVRHASTDEARARAGAARAREAAAREQAARVRADAEQAEDEAQRASEAERPATEDAPHEEQQAGSGARQDRERPGRDRREEARGASGRRGEREWGEWAGWTGWGGWPGAAGQHGWADPDAYRDLERLAKQFSRDLRSAAWHAQAVSEDALRDLRGILDETIDRIRAEVFKGKTPPGDPEHQAPPAD
ncbi:MAG TPA: helix-turn-helix transcriptional regulator [Streptosporangiaceae bacterium]|nr:helix-turn-helix transcriptional regulator [Streptosporangiaceae bacterium]